MATAVELVVDNLWIDVRGHSAAPWPGENHDDWLLRHAGWVRIRRWRGVLRVELDGRCAAADAVAATLDILRAMVADGRVIRRLEIWIHDGAGLDRTAFADPIAACRYLMRCIERSDAIETMTLQLFRSQAAAVETDTLELSALGALPELANAYLDWRNGRRNGLTPAVAGAVADRASLFRIDDGEPRVVSLGGGLTFLARDAAGARLDDLMPRPEADAARSRILAAVTGGEPALRRHRSPLIDITVLTLPLAGGPVPLALSISRRHAAAPARAAHATRMRAGGSGG